MDAEHLAEALKLALDGEAARNPPPSDGWRTIERRLRREPWRRAAVAAVASVVVAALAVTALFAVVHYPGRSASPVRACGHGLVPGYSDHRSYPPGIPTLPSPGARIVRCFASVAQAAGAGFAVATPPGTLIVRGVFLLPTGSLTMRQCRAAARAAGFAVPCPTVAPAMATTPLQLPNCNDGGECSMGRAGFVFFEGNFAIPPDYHAAINVGANFVLLASRTAKVTTNECPPHPPIGRARISGNDAAFVACPPYAGWPKYGPASRRPPYAGLLGGDVALRWVHQGVHVVVGFQGVNPTNIALDLAVARHLVWVAASPSS